jgi:hypothetical protein
MERLLALPAEGGNHTLTIFAQQLHGIYAIDRSWARTWLLPRFNPASPAAEAAWSGLLASARMPAPTLFKEIKQFFLSAIGASSRWTFGGLNHFAQLLILALDPPPRQKLLVSFKEARDALREASSPIRLEALFFLRNRIAQPRAWEKIIVPFFRNVWPRERKFQTPETTRTLVLFLEELGSRFPDGVDLVGDYLVPSPRVDTFVFQFGRDGDGGHGNLTTQYPQATLTVLDKTIDETLQHPPYGLADVLSKLVEAKPEIRYDERWQRLHRMTLA